MRMQEFITTNREQLTDLIGKSLSFVPSTASCFCHRNGTNHHHEAPKLTAKDLREWILNDEGLYRWARSEGVRI